MDESTFWKLIEEAKAEGRPELSSQDRILQTKLEGLPPKEIFGFQVIFDRLMAQAYRWDLWAAGYIIEGGCSDDGFFWFRAGLIGLGREAYHSAIENPETLANQPTKGVDFSNEEMAFAGRRAYEAATGREIPDTKQHDPTEPVGEKWDAETVGQKYPKLAKKFGFH